MKSFRNTRDRRSRTNNLYSAYRIVVGNIFLFVRRDNNDNDNNNKLYGERTRTRAYTGGDRGGLSVTNRSSPGRGVAVQYDCGERTAVSFMERRNIIVTEIVIVTRARVGIGRGARVSAVRGCVSNAIRNVRRVVEHAAARSRPVLYDVTILYRATYITRRSLSPATKIRTETRLSGTGRKSCYETAAAYLSHPVHGPMAGVGAETAGTTAVSVG